MTGRSAIASYFAYGINMDQRHLRGLCPEAVEVSRAVLRDHRFLINRGGWATVVKEAGSEVHGVLWRIGRRCLEELDRFEGVDERLYERVSVPVGLIAGETNAEIYLALDREPGIAEMAYIRAIVRAAAEAGVPEGYLAELERWRDRARELRLD